MNNTLVKKETQEEITNKALLTIKPEQYVKEVFAPFSNRLKKAVDAAKKVKYDIQTTSGMETAKEQRAIFRAIRIDADKERAARKAPLLAIGKLLESQNTELANQVTPYEEKFDSDIKAEEHRKEEIKVEAMRKEAARMADLQEKLDAIKNKPLEAINLNADATQALIDELSVIVPSEDNYQERFVEAELLLNQTIETMKQMVSGKRAEEQLAAMKKEQDIESNRVNFIKNKIFNIKNTILEAAELDSSIDVSLLISKINAVEINKDEYEEFSEEAESSRLTVLKALSRQYEALLTAEKISKQAVEENKKAVVLVDKADSYSETVVEFKHPEIKPHVVTDEDDVPSANEIINLVATTWNVSSETALKYLLAANFQYVTL